MTQTHLEIALKELATLHRTHAELSVFCPFPDDVKRQHLAPYSIPAAELFAMQDGLDASAYPDLRDALRGLGSDMLWRETYKDSDTDPDFMNRFTLTPIARRLIGINTLRNRMNWFCRFASMQPRKSPRACLAASLTHRTSAKLQVSL
jgi:hypothetical protein